MVKPEFWTDEITGSWPAEVQSLFLAITTLADDYGRFEASHNRLRGYAHCHRPDVSPLDVEAWLQRMISDDRVSLYDVGGQRYGVVLRFFKHQRPAERFKKRCPRPPDPLIVRMMTLCGKAYTDPEDERADLAREAAARVRERSLGGLSATPRLPLTGSCSGVGGEREEKSAGRGADNGIPGRANTPEDCGGEHAADGECCSSAYRRRIGAVRG